MFTDCRCAIRYEMYSSRCFIKCPTCGDRSKHFHVTLMPMLIQLSTTRLDMKELNVRNMITWANNPPVFSPVWALRSDRISFRYEKQRWRMHNIRVKQLRWSDIMSCRCLVESLHVIHHVVVQRTLKCSIFGKNSSRHSLGNLSDVSSWIPNLSNNSIDHRLKSRTVFLHLTDTFAPNVATNWKTVNHCLFVVVVVGEKCDEIEGDFLQEYFTKLIRVQV